VAIDIYEDRRLLMSVSTTAFLSLEHAQEELARASGRRVDAFATTSVEPEHVQLWLVGLRRILSTLGPRDPARVVCSQLIEVLVDVVQRRRTIMVEGE